GRNPRQPLSPPSPRLPLAPAPRTRAGLWLCCVPCAPPTCLRMLFSVSLERKIKTFATKMVITSGNDEDRGGQEKESKEESVLAMLGIIGTILNLIVIIFVYIYTTL
ncbi:mCG53020, isoform CRA_a, partial [Mus musculus]